MQHGRRALCVRVYVPERGIDLHLGKIEAIDVRVQHLDVERIGIAEELADLDLVEAIERQQELGDALWRSFKVAGRDEIVDALEQWYHRR